MEIKRSPLQGVTNIVRFNWHFYVFALVVYAAFFFALDYVPTNFQLWLRIILLASIAVTAISLLVSFYVYDLSELYELKWLDELLRESPKHIVNINAGFDETSILLQQKFPNVELFVFDFYDPEQHTEVSIKRARKAYPPFPNTKVVRTSHLPMEDHSIDVAFAILAAHEIRDQNERIIFFTELRRILKPDGTILVIEHLQDVANFLAYNIGFRHFHRHSDWLKTFSASGLNLQQERKITPFISAFVLKTNGITA